VANDKKRDDENIPWSLLITVMAVLLCFFIVMPIIGFMLYDLHYATQAAVYEAKKMRQLRKEILEERMYGK
jgi:predicted ABC-type sugar transport system permease subunit